MKFCFVSNGLVFDVRVEIDNLVLYASFFIFSHRLLPRAICTSQGMCSFSGIHVDACVSSHFLKNYVVAKDSLGWSRMPSSYCKQQPNKYLLPLGVLVTSNSKDVSTAPLIGEERIGVLLLNLGGPETLEDVQPFLFNLFADPVRYFCFCLWFENTCINT